jgi:hypothetical protein
MSLLERLWIVLFKFTRSPSRQIEPRLSHGVRLFVAVSNSALGQIVRRKLERNPVSRHDLDPVSAKPAGHRRQHWHACVEFHCKHSGSKLFDNLAHHFYGIFFWQTVSPIFNFGGGRGAAAVTAFMVGRLPATVTASAAATTT